MAKIKRRSKEAKDLQSPIYRQRIRHVSHPWMDDALEDYYNGNDQLDPKETEESTSSSTHSDSRDSKRGDITGEMVEQQVESRTDRK